MAITAYEVCYILVALAIVTIIASMFFSRKAEVVVVEIAETTEEKFAWAAALRLAKAATKLPAAAAAAPVMDPTALARETLEEIAEESIRRHFLSEEERDVERLARGEARRRELGL